MEKKRFFVECTMIYNGSIEVDAENEEEAIEYACEHMDEVSFQFGESTADYAYEIKK